MSAAQVAYHYGGYTLEDAVALSRDERDVLLAVAFDERQQQWERFEKVMGTTWDIKALAGLVGDENEGSKGPVQIPSKVRIPLLLAAAPEFFKAMTEEYKQKYQRMLSVMAEAGGPVVEIGTLSSEQARQIYKRLGASIASAQPPAQPPD